MSNFNQKYEWMMCSINGHIYAPDKSPEYWSTYSDLVGKYGTELYALDPILWDILDLRKSITI